MKHLLLAVITALSLIACGDRNNPSGSDKPASDSASAISTPLPNDAEAPTNMDNRPDSASGNTTGRGNMKTTDTITPKQ